MGTILIGMIPFLSFIITGVVVRFFSALQRKFYNGHLHSWNGDRSFSFLFCINRIYSFICLTFNNTSSPCWSFLHHANSASWLCSNIKRQRIKDCFNRGFDANAKQFYLLCLHLIFYRLNSYVRSKLNF